MSQDNLTIIANRRQLLGKKAKRLRKQGVVPAVLYGYNVQPTNLQVNAREFELTYRNAGKTSLVSLNVEDARPVRVFVHEVQRHPITLAAQHIDFHAVNLREEISAEVPIVLHGEAPAVHNNIGVLLRGQETVTVHALPTELPHQIDVSVEGLEDVDQALHVSDIRIDGNYRIETDPEEMIVKIAHPQLEPEVDEVAEAGAAAADGAEENAGA